MKKDISRPYLWLLLAIASAAGMGVYTTKIWSANQPSQFSDLYASWWAAHELLLHGRNPYSPALAHEIQTVIYGAPVGPTPVQDPAGISGGFAYPPYSALLLWPTIYTSFPTAQKTFVWVSALATLLSLALWLRMLGFRLQPLSWAVIAVFTLGSFPALQGLKLQNPSLIAAALIAITMYLLYADHLIGAGIFLALSSIKPQFTLVLIPWLVVWTLADWRRRRPMLWGFLSTMLLLILVSEWLVRGWIPTFLHVIGAYRRYTYGHSLLDVWFTPAWGPWIALGLVVGSFIFCWPHRFESAASPRFLRATSLVLAVTLVVIPSLAPHAQLLLLPGFLSLLRDRHLQSSTFARLSTQAAWALLVWPWIAAFGLLLASLWIPPAGLLPLWLLPLYASPLLPFAVLLSLVGILRAPFGAPEPISPSVSTP